MGSRRTSYSFPAIGDDHVEDDSGTLPKGQRPTLDANLALADGAEHRWERRGSLDQRVGRPELPDEMAVRGPEERQADLLGQPDRGAVEVDPCRVEVAEFDRIEEVDFLEESLAETDRPGKERGWRHHQPLRAAKSAMGGEGP